MSGRNASGIVNRCKITMLGCGKPEAEIVVAVIGVVVVTVGRRAVPRVIVPTAATVHTVRVASLIATHLQRYSAFNFLLLHSYVSA